MIRNYAQFVISSLMLTCGLSPSAVGQSSTSITVGSTVSATLNSTNAPSVRRPGSYAAYYTFQGSAGQTVAISLSAVQFDAYLYLTGPTGTLLGENDDSGSTSNARIPATGMLTLPSDGVYLIEVTSYEAGGYGDYTLILEGPCLAPPRGLVAFDILDYVSVPNAAGERLLVGQMSMDRASAISSSWNTLPLPTFPNQRFCGTLNVAPGVRAEVLVPTAAERVGNYSQANVVLWDPATLYAQPDGTEVMLPFPNNTVPLSRLMPWGPFAWRLASVLSSDPAVLPMSPASGNLANQTYSFKFTLPNGYKNLGVVNMLLNKFLDGRQACYLGYARQYNTLYLVNDAGDGLLPGLTLNGSGSVSNSQCTVFGAGSSVTGLGSTLTLTLNMSFSAGFAGNRTWYLAARDNLENNSGWQSLGVWSIPPAITSSPRVTSITPARKSGTRSQFSFQFTDDKGWQDLGVVNMLLNGALDGRNGCYLAYVRQTNVLYLVNDEGTALLPGWVLSSPGSLTNSQCTVNSASASGNGNVLTLNLDVSFGASFIGNRIWYLAARDVIETNSGWQAMGSWTIF